MGEMDDPGLVSVPGHIGHLAPFGRLRFPACRGFFCFLINKTVIWLHKGMPFNECNEKEALERKTVCVRDGPDAQRLTALRWPRFPFWGCFWNDVITTRFFPDDFHRLFLTTPF